MKLSIQLSILLMLFSCSRPPMTFTSKQVQLSSNQNALGIIFLPTVSIDDTVAVKMALGSGNVRKKFESFFQKEFKNAVLQHSAFTRIIYLNDSIPLKPQTVGSQNRHVEIRTPSISLEEYVCSGIDYMLILEDFSVDVTDKISIVGSSEPELDSEPMYYTDQFRNRSINDKVVNPKLKFSANAVLIDCSNDSLAGYGYIMSCVSGVNPGKTSIQKNIDKMVKQILKKSPFAFSRKRG